MARRAAPYESGAARATHSRGSSLFVARRTSRKSRSFVWSAPDRGLPRTRMAATRFVAVASRPTDPSSRHVGRIVDPLVREDGELEPEVSLDAGLPVEADPAVPAVSASGDEALVRGNA